MNLTKDQLRTLRHMLGINTPDAREPKPHRNYAAVNPGDPEFRALEAAGAVARYRSAGAGLPYDYYQCTDAGRAAAMASHKTIRYSKNKRVYGKFLEIRDCFPDLSFRDFLTRPDFDESRRSA